MSATPQHTLYDMPVSNNGARCRIILYKKRLSESLHVKIAKPSELDGLKSPEYLKLNPQGKMPLLVCNEDDKFSIPESDTIARYLLHKYADHAPTFQPDNPKSNVMCRFHDVYITSIQGCLYKAAGPFGTFSIRSDAINELKKQLNHIEDMVVENGPYLCGDEISLADATIFPTCIFIIAMLPKFVDGSPLPPKLQKWYDSIQKNEPAFATVYDEITTALQAWEDRGRWDTILGAGWRDNLQESTTIFDKIIAGDIPADIVHDDEHVLAFKDINPAAPVHYLVIPKQRQGLTQIDKASSDEHAGILGKLLAVAGELMKKPECEGKGRIVINNGKGGGQEVFHLHLHVLGGRDFTWPPG